jgi:hypothetical protein
MKSLSQLYWKAIGGAIEGFEMLPTMPITVEELIGKPWKIYPTILTEEEEANPKYLEFFYSDQFGLLLGHVTIKRSLLADAAANERDSHCLIKPDFLFTFITKKGKVNIKCEDVEDPEILKLEREHSVFSLVRVKGIRFWTFSGMSLLDFAKGDTGKTIDSRNDKSHHIINMDELLSILKWL